MDDLDIALKGKMEQLAKQATSAEEVERLLADFMKEVAEKLLESIKASAPEALRESRQEHEGFVERNERRWQEGFDLLEILLSIATEAGSEFNERLRPKAVEENDALFDVLVKLHAKGCLIGKEIACLLRNGFADGAQARWRSLHEVTVTALFLQKNGLEAAKRYIHHERIDSYRLAYKHRAHDARLNEKGPSEVEMVALKEQFDEIVGLYEPEFKNSYGWAIPYVRGNKPNFAMLEEAVQLEHWRPYYSWASQNVHATSKTLHRSLGMSEAKEPCVLVGPSNSGMTDPAHQTSLSITQLTSGLLMTNPNTDGTVMIMMLSMLSNELGEAFLDCGRKEALTRPAASTLMVTTLFSRLKNQLKSKLSSWKERGREIR